MSDPDAEDGDIIEDNPDYYSILNVQKDASDEEIKAAYRRMCVVYHPDKHQETKNKRVAESIFSKVHKAYDVLSNRQTRLIYDLYGTKGLDAGWEIIERTRTPKEIREEYERLQNEAEKKRIEQHTNPEGSTTVMIDLTDWFTSDENSDDPYYEDTTSLMPQICQMSIRQSIEAPLTKTNTAILSGSIVNANGNGTGSVNCAIRKVFSHKSFGEVEVGGGDGATIRVKGYRSLGKKISGTITLNSAVKQSRIGAGFNAILSRQLSNHTMGHLTWSGGMSSTLSSMSSLLIRSTERYNASLKIQLNPSNPCAMVAYTHKFNTDTKAKVSLRFGMLGLNFMYGCEHKITSLSRVGAYMRIGHGTGVTLEIRVYRHTQSFNFPILLSDVFSPTAVFYGTVTPIIMYYTLKALVIAPMMRQQNETDMKESQEKFATFITEKRQEAREAINLMFESFERAVNQEQEKHGLIITSAYYGKFDPDSILDVYSNLITDVRVPVQCLVRDSKLILTDATKSQLNGFYDPCPGQEKHLKIIYEFRDAVHEAVFSDTDHVRMPKQYFAVASARD